MPAASQSNVPLTASNWVAMAPGNVYKSAIDVCTSILSPFGMFYVYQNSPVGMSVLVDDAFNFIQPGSGFVLQPTASAVSVALTAPTTNPYYGTIYWNSLTNSFGVVYGAQATSPTPILPDDAAFIPLALVLLSPGQTSVTSANITDLRSWFRFGPVRYYNATLTAPAVINAAGASSVAIDITGGGSQSITINNLQVGVPVQLIVRAAGSTLTLTLSFNTPSGAAYTIRQKVPGATTGFIGLSGGGFSAGTAWIYSGITEYVGTTPEWIAPSC